MPPIGTVNSMTFIFWLLIKLILYCYFGYPLIMAVLSWVLPRPIKKGECEPAVSIVLSIWNEEDVIKNKIENLLALDYPEEKVEILIGSDG
jgi:cellulose synthase/poly-beta-1,6-N-acetylglucosamine synthase-like glycosyltransferase